MMAIVDFLFTVLNALLSLSVWVVIASVVVSWLVTFQVINLRNPTAYGVVQFLERVSRAVLWPLRRIIPAIGGIDITPLIYIIVVQAAQSTLLPALHNELYRLFGGAALI